MHISKLRVPAEENGMVPVGTYFERLANALREANERAGNIEAAPRAKVRSSVRRVHTESAQMEMSL